MVNINRKYQIFVKDLHKGDTVQLECVLIEQSKLFSSCKNA